MPVTHYSPKQRPIGISLSGACFGMYLASLSFALLWPIPVQASPHTKQAEAKKAEDRTPDNTTQPDKRPSKPPRLSQQERLVLAEKQLKNARTDAEMAQALAHTESLRQHGLNGATRLLADESAQQAKSGALQKAVEALNAAIALQPDNGLLRRSRAELRFTGNDPMGAVQDLALSLKNDPGDVLAWAILAKVEEALHNHQEALTAFQNALTRAPLFPQGKEILRHFQKNAYGQAD